MDSNFDRRSGIGASMAPEILGLSPWGTPLSAYLWYVGMIPDKAETGPMAIGTAVESAIRKLTEERLQREIVAVPTQRHQERLFLYASPDGMFYDDLKNGFEAKNVGPARAKDWGEEGSDEVPDYVNIQCQHQAFVCGFDTVTVGVLICGNSFRLYNVRRNERLISAMIERLADFWDRLGKRIPPDPDWSHATTPALVQKMYGIDETQQITLGAEYAAMVDAYENYKAVEKEAKDAKEYAQAKLMLGMQAAALAWLPDGTAIVRKKVSRKAYEVKASEYFTFSVKRRKELTHDGNNERNPAIALARATSEPANGNGPAIPNRAGEAIGSAQGHGD